MTLRTAGSLLGGVLAPKTLEPGAFGSTMVGGTSLVGNGLGNLALGTWNTTDYVVVRVEEILEYERTILELQRELVHYRRLLMRHLDQQGVAHEYPEPVFPLDAASVRVVDSILAARVPTSATFIDFEEGEL